MSDDLGPQPLEAVMARHALTPAHLVRESNDPLSFKMVQKGRKGRRLTPNVQRKILTALKAAITASEGEKMGDAENQLPPASTLTLKDLFNYT